jgi:hypothetical protein
MVRPTVFVCRGTSCRHHKAYDELRAAINEVADVADVRCQRVCDGPLVGAAIEGSLEWFCQMDSGKAQRQFIDLIAGTGQVRPGLKKRRVKKRSGRLR